MKVKFSSLLSETALATALALTGSLVTIDSALAGAKKSDRLPIMSATNNICDDNIIGMIKDECFQQSVENAVIKPVRTTVVELRDENANISTLVRVPVVDMAKVQVRQ